MGRSMARLNRRTRRQIRFLLALTLSLSMIVMPALTSNRPTQARGLWQASATAPTPAANNSAETQASAREAYGKVGLSFEANRGQTDEQVNFLARGAGYTLFLTSAEAVFVLANSDC
jgi:hypothetical protein